MLPSRPWRARACSHSRSPVAAAASRRPTTRLSAAQTDIGRAEAGGAPSNPEAKLHLQLATEDLQKAKSQVDQDNKRATSPVALSRVEAQLALSLAKAAQAQAAAQAAQQDVQKAKGGN